MNLKYSESFTFWNKLQEKMKKKNHHIQFFLDVPVY